VRNTSLRTRLRARLLRTFRGRSAADAAWLDELPTSAGAPETFALGGLVVTVTPRGLKAAGANAPSMVYEVGVSLAAGPGRWASRYGLEPRQASVRRAAEAALDELDEVAADPAAWTARVTAGMSEDEAEAMLDSPSVVSDLEAAGWVGPYLRGLRERRRTTGAWLGAPGSSS
jgi:hypothetical protein